MNKNLFASALRRAGIIAALAVQVAQGEVTWSVDNGAGFADGGGTLSFVDVQSFTSLESSGTNGERAMLDPNGYARPGLPGTKIFLR